MTTAQILDERVDGLRHTFHVSLDAGLVDAAVESRLRVLGRAVRLPGFRPGRAPLKLLRNRYGKQVQAEVIDHAAIDVARRLIAEKGLEPTRRPVIEIGDSAAPSADAVTFTLLLEVMPEVELGKLDGFQLRHLRAVNEDPELAEQAGEYLRRQLFDALIEQHPFPVPNDMVENEYALIRSGFEVQVGEAVDAELEAEFRSIAVRRVQLAILLAEIGRAHGITVTRAEVEELVESEAEREPEHQAEIIDYYLDHPTALAELQAPLFEARVVEFLLARSDIEVVELPEDEFWLAVTSP